jgi:hypothetical protein
MFFVGRGFSRDVQELEKQGLQPLKDYRDLIPAIDEMSSRDQFDRMLSAACCKPSDHSFA